MKNPLDSLDAVVQALVAALKPQRVLLFGSAARPESSEINDLDLLVVAESSASPIDRIVDARMAVAPQGVPVDLFVHTPRCWSTSTS